MEFRIEDPHVADVRDVLREHEAHSSVRSPPESTHVLDLDGLKAPSVTFWTLRDGGAVVGCCALKEISPVHGEVKSMHVAETARGYGYGTRLLQHLIDEGRARSYERLSLETGLRDGYAAARALYERFEFKPCGPFGNYRPDPNSLFMTCVLTAAHPTHVTNG
ncbi:MAG: GNAT family N-acetyltransferase [Pseudomonadota bacterium]